MRKIIVSNNFLSEVADVLRRGNSVKVKIDGISMLPFIIGGKDLVEIVPLADDEDLKRWCCPLFCWNGKYMVHRYIGKEGNDYLMLGDGNVSRIERVKREDIIGVLRYIIHPDGSVQDCRDENWLKKGMWWYRLRPLRRFILPVLRRCIK